MDSDRNAQEKSAEFSKENSFIEQAAEDYQGKVSNLLDHWLTQIFMLIVTVYALIGEDLRLLYFKQEADLFFMNSNIATLVIFSLEIILSCFAKKKYFNSFFFWLDIISTISIITDIEPVWAAIVGDTLSAEN